MLLLNQGGQLNDLGLRRVWEAVLLIGKGSCRVRIIPALQTKGQADQTSRSDQDSPGLERDVPVSRKGKFRAHLFPGLQKVIPGGTEGITCDFPSLQYFINEIVSTRQARSAEAV